MRAVELATVVSARRLPRVTTNYVLAEAITWLRRKLGHAPALRFGQGIQRDVIARNLQVIYADKTLDDAAWEIFQRHADQDFSFVDCVSFAWLRQNPQVLAFAFDQYFNWMGFMSFE